jgi:hypothetical protein
MFVGRQRASGLEFATCEQCNVGSRAADVVASFMAFISPREIANDPLLPELVRIKAAVNQYAPGLIPELLDSNPQRKWRWTPKGLVAPHVQIQADGPILYNHLATFSAKMAMALYRQHVGVPLPLDGAVYTTHYLNSGLSKEVLEASLGIMPLFDNLKQGTKTSSGQFDYRYNCDEKSILGAIVSLHSNLHILLFATSDPTTYGGLLSSARHMTTSRPGTFLDRLQAGSGH